MGIIFFGQDLDFVFFRGEIEDTTTTPLTQTVVSYIFSGCVSRFWKGLGDIFGYFWAGLWDMLGICFGGF